MKRLLALLFLSLAVPVGAAELDLRRQFKYEPERGVQLASLRGWRAVRGAQLASLRMAVPFPILPQVVVSGGGGASTITATTTPTSGCVAGGLLYSASNLVDCNGPTYAGGTVTLTNGVAAVSPLIVKDNVTAVFAIADGGQMQASAGTSSAPGISFIAQPTKGLAILNNNPFLVNDTNHAFGLGAVAWTASNTGFAVGDTVAGNLTADVFLMREAAAVWRLGAPAAAAPIAQALTAQRSRGGTDTNVAGGNITVYSGLGTGTAAPSELIFRTGVVQATGTAQHTLVDAFKMTAGGFQNTRGELALNADYTNATAVMSNTALSPPDGVVAGRTYSFSTVLLFSNSTAADGFLIDFNGGTATVTNFRAHCHAANAAGASLAFTNAASVALDTDIDVTLALTTQALMTCQGTFVPAAAGTFILRASEKVDGGGTLTIFRGSWLHIRDANPL